MFGQGERACARVRSAGNLWPRARYRSVTAGTRTGWSWDFGRCPGPGVCVSIDHPDHLQHRDARPAAFRSVGDSLTRGFGPALAMMIMQSAAMRALALARRCSVTVRACPSRYVLGVPLGLLAVLHWFRHKLHLTEGVSPPASNNGSLGRRRTCRTTPVPSLSCRRVQRGLMITHCHTGATMHAGET